MYIYICTFTSISVNIHMCIYTYISHHWSMKSPRDIRSLHLPAIKHSWRIRRSFPAGKLQGASDTDESIWGFL